MRTTSRGNNAFSIFQAVIVGLVCALCIVNYNLDTLLVDRPTSSLSVSLSSSRNGKGKGKEPTDVSQSQRETIQPPLHDTQSSLPATTTTRFGPPDDENTAIVLIAFGNITNTWTTERCLRSIRMGGEFKGTVVVITDKVGYKKYSETLHGINKVCSSGVDNNKAYNSDTKDRRNHNQVVVMENRKEDAEPKNENGHNAGHYENRGAGHYKNRRVMLYKRYKTLVLKYVKDATKNEGDSIDQQRVSHVLYLDIDNIVTRPLSNFFNDYFDSIRRPLADARMMVEGLKHDNVGTVDHSHSATSGNSSSNANANANAKDFGFFSIWRDQSVRHLGDKNGELVWQSGQIMFSMEHSAPCVDAWRNEMDNEEKAMMDQTLLFNVYNQNFSESRCLFFELPKGIDDDTEYSEEERLKNHHFRLLGRRFAQFKNRSEYPTIVHITTPGLNRVDEQHLSQFLEKSLFLEDLSPPSGVTWNGTTFGWDEIVETFMEEQRRKKKMRFEQLKKNSAKRKEKASKRSRSGT